MRVSVTKDMLGGMVFAAAGIGTLVTAQNYKLGTIGHMGSGYFPTMVGGALTLLGLVSVVIALIRPKSSDPVGEINIRPFLIIGAAIAAFGLLLEDFGLVVALAALILIARLADPERRTIEALTMVGTLVLIAVGIFVFALETRISLGPF